MTVSIFTGRQYPGAMRVHREALRVEANLRTVPYTPAEHAAKVDRVAARKAEAARQIAALRAQAEVTR